MLGGWQEEKGTRLTGSQLFQFVFFHMEKLKDSNVLETSQAMIGGKFASLTIMSNEDADRFNDHHL